MLASLSHQDLLLLSNALNEVRNAANIPPAAFQTRLGATAQEATDLQQRLADLMISLDSKERDEGHDEWATDFGAPAPSLDRIAALAEEAVGDENQDLRRALYHYGTLRAHGPSWVAELRAVPGLFDAVPAGVRDMMVWFLGRYPAPGA